MTFTSVTDRTATRKVPSDVQFTNCILSQRTAGGRISRTVTITRTQLLKLSYDKYSISTCRNIALAILRGIKDTPVRIRKTRTFVREVCHWLTILNSYNRAATETKGKFPFSKALIYCLVGYVQLEYHVLYYPENYCAEYEKEVEKRVLRMLHIMLNGAEKKLGYKNTENAVSKCALCVLNKVKAEYKEEGKLVCSLIIKLLKRLGLWETVTKIQQNSMSVLENDSATLETSCDNLDYISDCDSDDSIEYPMSPAQCRTSSPVSNKLKLNSPVKLEPPHLDSGQECQLLERQKGRLLYYKSKSTDYSSDEDDYLDLKDIDLVNGSVQIDHNKNFNKRSSNKNNDNVAIQSTNVYKSCGDLTLNNRIGERLICEDDGSCSSYYSMRGGKSAGLTKSKNSTNKDSETRITPTVISSEIPIITLDDEDDEDDIIELIEDDEPSEYVSNSQISSATRDEVIFQNTACGGSASRAGSLWNMNGSEEATPSSTKHEDNSNHEDFSIIGRRPYEGYTLQDFTGLQIGHESCSNIDDENVEALLILNEENTEEDNCLTETRSRGSMDIRFKEIRRIHISSPNNASSKLDPVPETLNNCTNSSSMVSSTGTLIEKDEDVGQDNQAVDILNLQNDSNTISVIDQMEEGQIHSDEIPKIVGIKSSCQLYKSTSKDLSAKKPLVETQDDTGETLVETRKLFLRNLETTILDEAMESISIEDARTPLTAVEHSEESSNMIPPQSILTEEENIISEENIKSPTDVSSQIIDEDLHKLECIENVQKEDSQSIKNPNVKDNQDQEQNISFEKNHEAELFEDTILNTKEANQEICERLSDDTQQVFEDSSTMLKELSKDPKLEAVTKSVITQDSSSTKTLSNVILPKEQVKDVSFEDDQNNETLNLKSEDKRQNQEAETKTLEVERSPAIEKPEVEEQKSLDAQQQIFEDAPIQMKTSLINQEKETFGKDVEPSVVECNTNFGKEQNLQEKLHEENGNLTENESNTKNLNQEVSEILCVSDTKQIFGDSSADTNTLLLDNLQDTNLEVVTISSNDQTQPSVIGNAKDPSTSMAEITQALLIVKNANVSRIGDVDITLEKDIAPSFDTASNVINNKEVEQVKYINDDQNQNTFDSRNSNITRFDENQKEEITTLILPSTEKSSAVEKPLTETEEQKSLEINELEQVLVTSLENVHGENVTPFSDYPDHDIDITEEAQRRFISSTRLDQEDSTEKIAIELQEILASTSEEDLGKSSVLREKEHSFLMSSELEQELALSDDSYTSEHSDNVNNKSSCFNKDNFRETEDFIASMDSDQLQPLQVEALRCDSIQEKQSEEITDYSTENLGYKSKEVGDDSCIASTEFREEVIREENAIFLSNSPTNDTSCERANEAIIPSTITIISSDQEIKSATEIQEEKDLSSLNTEQYLVSNERSILETVQEKQLVPELREEIDVRTGDITASEQIVHSAAEIQEEKDIISLNTEQQEPTVENVLDVIVGQALITVSHDESEAIALMNGMGKTQSLPTIEATPPEAPVSESEAETNNTNSKELIETVLEVSKVAEDTFSREENLPVDIQPDSEFIKNQMNMIPEEESSFLERKESLVDSSKDISVQEDLKNSWTEEKNDSKSVSEDESIEADTDTLIEQILDNKEVRSSCDNSESNAEEEIIKTVEEQFVKNSNAVDDSNEEANTTLKSNDAGFETENGNQLVNHNVVEDANNDKADNTLKPNNEFDTDTAFEKMSNITNREMNNPLSESFPQKHSTSIGSKDKDFGEHEENFSPALVCKEVSETTIKSDVSNFYIEGSTESNQDITSSANNETTNEDKVEGIGKDIVVDDGKVILIVQSDDETKDENFVYIIDADQLGGDEDVNFVLDGHEESQNKEQVDNLETIDINSEIRALTVTNDKANNDDDYSKSSDAPARKDSSDNLETVESNSEIQAPAEVKEKNNIEYFESSEVSTREDDIANLENVESSSELQTLSEPKDKNNDADFGSDDALIREHDSDNLEIVESIPELQASSESKEKNNDADYFGSSDALTREDGSHNLANFGSSSKLQTSSDYFGRSDDVPSREVGSDNLETVESNSHFQAPSESKEKINDADYFGSSEVSTREDDSDNLENVESSSKLQPSSDYFGYSDVPTRKVSSDNLENVESSSKLQASSETKDKINEADYFRCGDVSTREDDSDPLKTVENSSELQSSSESKENISDCFGCSDIPTREDGSDHLENVESNSMLQTSSETKEKNNEADSCSVVIPPKEDSNNLDTNENSSELQSSSESKEQINDADHFGCSDVLTKKDDSDNMDNVESSSELQTSSETKEKINGADYCSDVIPPREDSDNLENIESSSELWAVSETKENVNDADYFESSDIPTTEDEICVECYEYQNTHQQTDEVQGPHFTSLSFGENQSVAGHQTSVADNICSDLNDINGINHYQEEVSEIIYNSRDFQVESESETVKFSPTVDNMNIAKPSVITEGVTEEYSSMTLQLHQGNQCQQLIDENSAITQIEIDQVHHSEPSIARVTIEAEDFKQSFVVPLENIDKSSEELHGSKASYTETPKDLGSSVRNYDSAQIQTNSEYFDNDNEDGCEEPCNRENFSFYQTPPAVQQTEENDFFGVRNKFGMSYKDTTNNSDVKKSYVVQTPEQVEKATGLAEEKLFFLATVAASQEFLKISPKDPNQAQTTESSGDDSKDTLKVPRRKALRAGAGDSRQIRSRVKMAGRSGTKGEKSVKPNEISENVPNQSAIRISTTTTESDFNTISEDSSDSFLSGKLVIAEDSKHNETSPAYSGNEYQQTHFAESIYDEDTVEEKLEFVKTMLDDIENTEVQISISDSEEFLAYEGYFPYIEKLTASYNFDPQIKIGSVTLKNIENLKDPPCLENQPEIQMEKFTELPVEKDLLKDDVQASPSDENPKSITTPPTDYSIDTILKSEFVRSIELQEVVAGPFETADVCTTEEFGSNFSEHSPKDPLDDCISVVQKQAEIQAQGFTIYNTSTKDELLQDNSAAIVATSMMSHDGEILNVSGRIEKNNAKANSGNAEDNEEIQINNSLSRITPNVEFQDDEAVSQHGVPPVTETSIENIVRPIRTKAELKAYDGKCNSKKENTIAASANIFCHLEVSVNTEQVKNIRSESDITSDEKALGEVDDAAEPKASDGTCNSNNEDVSGACAEIVCNSDISVEIAQVKNYSNDSNEKGMEDVEVLKCSEKKGISKQEETTHDSTHITSNIDVSIDTTQIKSICSKEDTDTAQMNVAEIDDTSTLLLDITNPSEQIDAKKTDKFSVENAQEQQEIQISISDSDKKMQNALASKSNLGVTNSIGPIISAKSSGDIHKLAVEEDISEILKEIPNAAATDDQNATHSVKKDDQQGSNSRPDKFKLNSYVKLVRLQNLPSKPLPFSISRKSYKSLVDARVLFKRSKNVACNQKTKGVVVANRNIEKGLSEKGGFSSVDKEKCLNDPARCLKEIDSQKTSDREQNLTVEMTEINKIEKREEEQVDCKKANPKISCVDKSKKPNCKEQNVESTSKLKEEEKEDATKQTAKSIRGRRDVHCAITRSLSLRSSSKKNQCNENHTEETIEQSIKPPNKKPAPIAKPKKVAYATRSSSVDAQSDHSDVVEINIRVTRASSEEAKRNSCKIEEQKLKGKIEESTEQMDSGTKVVKESKRRTSRVTSTESKKNNLSAKNPDKDNKSKSKTEKTNEESIKTQSNDLVDLVNLKVNETCRRTRSSSSLMDSKVDISDAVDPNVKTIKTSSASKNSRPQNRRNSAIEKKISIENAKILRVEVTKINKPITRNSSKIDLSEICPDEKNTSKSANVEDGSQEEITNTQAISTNVKSEDDSKTNTSADIDVKKTDTPEKLDKIDAEHSSDSEEEYTLEFIKEKLSRFRNPHAYSKLYNKSLINEEPKVYTNETKVANYNITARAMIADEVSSDDEVNSDDDRKERRSTHGSKGNRRLKATLKVESSTKRKSSRVVKKELQPSIDNFNIEANTEEASLDVERELTVGVDIDKEKMQKTHLKVLPKSNGTVEEFDKSSPVVKIAAEEVSQDDTDEASTLLIDNKKLEKENDDGAIRRDKKSIEKEECVVNENLNKLVNSKEGVIEISAAKTVEQITEKFHEEKEERAGIEKNDQKDLPKEKAQEENEVIAKLKENKNHSVINNEDIVEDAHEEKESNSPEEVNVVKDENSVNKVEVKEEVDVSEINKPSLKKEFATKKRNSRKRKKNDIKKALSSGKHGEETCELVLEKFDNEKEVTETKRQKLSKKDNENTLQTKPENIEEEKLSKVRENETEKTIDIMTNASGLEISQNLIEERESLETANEVSLNNSSKNIQKRLPKQDNQKYCSGKIAASKRELIVCLERMKVLDDEILESLNKSAKNEEILPNKMKEPISAVSGPELSEETVEKLVTEESQDTSEVEDCQAKVLNKENETLVSEGVDQRPKEANTKKSSNDSKLSDQEGTLTSELEKNRLEKETVIIVDKNESVKETVANTNILGDNLRMEPNLIERRLEKEELKESLSSDGTNAEKIPCGNYHQTVITSTSKQIIDELLNRETSMEESSSSDGIVTTAMDVQATKPSVFDTNSVSNEDSTSKETNVESLENELHTTETNQASNETHADVAASTDVETGKYHDSTNIFQNSNKKSSNDIECTPKCEAPTESLKEKSAESVPEIGSTPQVIDEVLKKYRTVTLETNKAKSIIKKGCVNFDAVPGRSGELRTYPPKKRVTFNIKDEILNEHKLRSAKNKTTPTIKKDLVCLNSTHAIDLKPALKKSNIKSKIVKKETIIDVDIELKRDSRVEVNENIDLKEDNVVLDKECLFDQAEGARQSKEIDKTSLEIVESTKRKSQDELEIPSETKRAKERDFPKIDIENMKLSVKQKMEMNRNKEETVTSPTKQKDGKRKDIDTIINNLRKREHKKIDSPKQNSNLDEKLEITIIDVIDEQQSKAVEDIKSAIRDFENKKEGSKDPKKRSEDCKHVGAITIGETSSGEEGRNHHDKQLKEACANNAAISEVLADRTINIVEGTNKNSLAFIDVEQKVIENITHVNVIVSEEATVNSSSEEATVNSCSGEATLNSCLGEATLKSSSEEPTVNSSSEEATVNSLKEDSAKDIGQENYSKLENSITEVMDHQKIIEKSVIADDTLPQTPTVDCLIDSTKSDTSMNMDLYVTQTAENDVSPSSPTLDDKVPKKTIPSLPISEEAIVTASMEDSGENVQENDSELAARKSNENNITATVDHQKTIEESAMADDTSPQNVTGDYLMDSTELDTSTKMDVCVTQTEENDASLSSPALDDKTPKENVPTLPTENEEVPEKSEIGNSLAKEINAEEILSGICHQTVITSTPKQAVEESLLSDSINAEEIPFGNCHQTVITSTPKQTVDEPLNRETHMEESLSGDGINAKEILSGICHQPVITSTPKQTVDDPLNNRDSPMEESSSSDNVSTVMDVQATKPSVFDTTSISSDSGLMDNSSSVSVDDEVPEKTKVIHSGSVTKQINTEEIPVSIVDNSFITSTPIKIVDRDDNSNIADVSSDVGSKDSSDMVQSNDQDSDVTIESIDKETRIDARESKDAPQTVTSDYLTDPTKLDNSVSDDNSVFENSNIKALADIKKDQNTLNQSMVSDIKLETCEEEVNCNAPSSIANDDLDNNLDLKTSQSKELECMSSVADDTSISEVVVSAATQLSNLISWTSVTVPETFLYNTDEQQNTIQSEASMQEDIFDNSNLQYFSNRMSEAAKEAEAPRKLDPKPDVLQNLERKADELIPISMAQVKEETIADKALKTSVASSIGYERTHLSTMTMRMSSYVNDQILSISENDLPVTPENATSAPGKSFDPIDEDTLLTDKVKERGSIRFGGTSDHDYSVGPGGPFLVSTEDNDNIFPFSDESVCTSTLMNNNLTQEQDERGSTEDLSNSPVDNNIFPSVCIGSFMDHDLMQETARSLNHSPVDGANNYQFNTTLTEDINSLNEDLKVESLSVAQLNNLMMDNHHGSILNNLTLDDHHGTNLALSRIAKISEENRKYLSDYDLVDQENIISRIASGEDIKLPHQQNSKGTSEMTVPETNEPKFEAAVLKVEVKYNEHAYQSGDRIKNVVCPDTPQLNKNDMIQISNDKGDQNQKQKTAEGVVKKPLKKQPSEEQETPSSRAFSALKAQAILNMQKKKPETKPKNAHFGFPIRQNNRTPVCAPVKKDSPPQHKKSPEQIANQSTSPSPDKSLDASTDKALDVIKSQTQVSEQSLNASKSLPIDVKAAAVDKSKLQVDNAVSNTSEISRVYEKPKEDFKESVKDKLNDMLGNIVIGKPRSETPKINYTQLSSSVIAQQSTPSRKDAISSDMSFNQSRSTITRQQSQSNPSRSASPMVNNLKQSDNMQSSATPPGGASSRSKHDIFDLHNQNDFYMDKFTAIKSKRRRCTERLIDILPPEKYLKIEEEAKSRSKYDDSKLKRGKVGKSKYRQLVDYDDSSLSDEQPLKFDKEQRKNERVRQILSRRSADNPAETDFLTKRRRPMAEEEEMVGGIDGNKRHKKNADSSDEDLRVECKKPYTQEEVNALFDRLVKEGPVGKNDAKLSDNKNKILNFDNKNSSPRSLAPSTNVRHLQNSKNPTNQPSNSSSNPERPPAQDPRGDRSHELRAYQARASASQLPPSMNKQSMPSRKDKSPIVRSYHSRSSTTQQQSNTPAVILNQHQQRNVCNYYIDQRHSSRSRNPLPGSRYPCLPENINTRKSTDRSRLQMINPQRPLTNVRVGNPRTPDALAWMNKVSPYLPERKVTFEPDP